MKNSIWALVLGATALTPVAPAIATAQSRAKVDEKRHFDIASGDLATALRAWTKATRRELIYRSADIERRVSAGVTGDMAPITALMALLEGTGLQVVTSDDGAIAVRPAVDADVGSNATPEILVQGKASWSLNTGIERTQDDSQPFIVMTREEIQRSGAPDLDTFLRNQLNVNTSPVVGQQATARPNTAGTPVGLSAINLRGLGLRDTLILVDGRRQPGINVGSGDIGQPSITGIPIAAIERIEVLASSASGIYGSGASGGVINIIMRRDFNGGELAMTYSDTTDFAQGEGRIDLTAGMPLEGGRTRVSVTGNYTKGDPLTYGSRYSLAERGLNTILANNPDYFEGPYQMPPTASRVNFKSSNGTPLVLKPEYGGDTLQSGIGSIPTGYRGVAADGIAPLLAGIGSYDLAQPDSATGTGTRAPLLYGTEQYRGALAVRREFNKVITGYAELGVSRSSATTVYAVRAARHFDYHWPIQYRVTDFSVITDAAADGRGQTDVGGIYAWIMLQAFELTDDKTYLDEARAAIDAAMGLRFNVNYQANLTAWGAAACMRLWRITNRDVYREQSYVYLASFLHNGVMWDSNIGHAASYETFMAVTCLQDAPYMAMYECFDSFVAFEQYLNDGGPDLEPGARMLIGEYCRYAATKAGVQAFAETLRKEVAERNIKVSVIQPGSVDTDMQQCSPDEKRAAVANGEMLVAEEIAEAIVFTLTRSATCDVVNLRIEPLVQKTS